jgi:hypothetical protein
MTVEKNSKTKLEDEAARFNQQDSSSRIQSAGFNQQEGTTQ